jgi:hypothetical protein
MITTTALALSLLATLALGLFLLDKASLVSAMKAQGKAGDEAAASTATPRKEPSCPVRPCRFRRGRLPASAK